MRLSSGAETKKAVDEEDDQQAQRASRHSEPSRVKSVKSSQVKSRARRDREADNDWASASGLKRQSRGGKTQRRKSEDPAIQWVRLK